MNLIGQTFGLYKVVGVAHRADNGRVIQWECLCSCGNKRIVPQRNLLNGNSKSCGCSKKVTVVPGQRYGRLVLIELAGFKLENHSSNRPNAERRTPLWKCQCDCGKTNIVSLYALRQGGTKSCGCLSKELSIARSSLSPGEASCNIVIAKYKLYAKKRDLIFVLTKDQCLKLFSGNCHYCGKAPSNKATYRAGATSFTYSGIDRIDSSRGYEIDNVVSCCHLCNSAKTNTPQSEFATWVRQVNEYWASKFS
jgi:hypothetical protein